MKCYNHHDRDAFGICQSCGKALCLECMNTEVETVVCKNSVYCNDKYNQTKAFVDNANIIYSSKNKKTQKFIGLLFILLSIPFWFSAIVNFVDTISLLFAIFFISFGVIIINKANSLKTTK